MTKTILFLSIALCLFSCGGKPSGQNGPASQSTTPVSKIPSIPKDGNYTALGKVTKIDAKNGSVEIDHEEIPDMMPAMKMEFNVKDKNQLNGIAVGDTVKFVIEYKHPAETITYIKKADK